MRPVKSTVTRSPVCEARPAACPGLEIGQPPAPPDPPGHRAAPAPRKFVPVYAPGKIPRDPVTRLRGAPRRFPADALLAQDLDRAVHVGVVYRVGGSLDLDGRQIAELDLRVDLEGSAEGQLFLVAALLALDTRIAGDLQLLFLDHRGKRFLHRVADHFRAYLRPIVLRDDLERNFARAKTFRSLPCCSRQRSVTPCR